MKKLIPYIALIPLVLLALCPPWSFQLDCTVNSLFWLWMVLLSGFATFLFIYQNVSIWLKLFLIYSFISCFFSRAPFISFTMLWSVVVCAYYYVLCRNIENWTPVVKTIQAIFFLICSFLIIQLFGKDTLFNFYTKTPVIFGTIGNRMIFSSFVSCLAPFLIINPLNWIPLSLLALISHSSGAVLALGMGGATLLWFKVKRARIALVALIIAIPIIFAFKTGDFSKDVLRAGRLPMWNDGIQLCLKKPMGYGIATWKILYPVLCSKEVKAQQPGREWSTAHNDFLQIPFEVGIPGLILLAGWVISILRKLKDPLKIAGLMILVGTMSVHFPARLCQTVLIIIMYIAYCERKSDELHPL